MTPAPGTAFAAWSHGRDYRVVPGGPEGDVLFIAGTHRLLRVSDDLGMRLRGGLDRLDDEERGEWNWLADHGIIAPLNRDALAAASPLDGADLAINVNLTAACNLSCSYCFADGGDYGRFSGRMPPTSVAEIFRIIDERTTPTRRVRFEFFGGEPLLNLERIAEICQQSDAVARERGLTFIYRISTNLTVLPQAAVDLFAARRFIVSVSIDGAPAAHDRNRPTKSGAGSYETILANCRRVRQASGAITLVARMTVTGGAPTLWENVRHLWALNLFDYFQIYPAVVAPGRGLFLSRDALRASGRVTTATGPMIAPQVMAEFEELLDRYLTLFEPGNRFAGVLEYERLADMMMTGKLALAFCSAGRNYFTASPDGSIAACHRLAGDPTLQVGHGHEIDDDLDAWRGSVDDNPVCSACGIRYLCGGGCKQENLVASGSLQTPAPDLCAYQVLLADRVARLVAEADAPYRRRDRSAFDHLFVSCGRPVTANGRAAATQASHLRHFQPV